MYKPLRNILCILSTLILFTSGSSADSGDWQIIEKSGAVRIVKPDNSADVVTTGEMLGAGAVLTTGMDGHAVLSRSGHEITVGPNSRMSLPRAEKPGMIRVIQEFGTLMFKVDKRENTQFHVDTPYIAAVVKGTSFTVTAGPDKHEIEVTEGVVEVSPTHGSAQEQVKAGETAEISPDNPTVIHLDKGARNQTAAAPMPEVEEFDTDIAESDASEIQLPIIAKQDKADETATRSSHSIAVDPVDEDMPTISRDAYWSTISDLRPNDSDHDAADNDGVE